MGKKTSIEWGNRDTKEKTNTKRQKYDERWRGRENEWQRKREKMMMDRLKGSPWFYLSPPWHRYFLDICINYLGYVKVKRIRIDIQTSNENWKGDKGRRYMIRWKITDRKREEVRFIAKFAIRKKDLKLSTVFRTVGFSRDKYEILNFKCVSVGFAPRSF